ncbi:aldo/keto reductase [Zobellia galactanivorans]|uniref:aldo/keto reductase n=1 Tax=Zobellia galactanivorans (strain DSM 12802 / CCUG 47099 / CIP 106680 / NCIMB 13871 / Dsij) TaxID=63186 RepID=UPI0026E14B1A|nr:aldo/keto reductase [Zobellia galactanivorans]MDO6809212.1 aldo/keto reductase [Zobellia galactanivorans]
MKKITDLQGTFALNNGVEIPYLGLGTYLADNDQDVVDAVKTALNLGYRHIDTAAIYKNEEGVGKGIRQSNVAREEVFLVSKVWNADQGYESTLKAFEASLERLGVEYLDLYLIHWPVAGKYKDTWRAMEKLYREKRIRAIGVSNFLRHHLEDLLETAEIVPMVNQMEFHPYLVQQDLIDFCNDKGVQYESWSPFMHGKVFDAKSDVFDGLTGKYNKSIAQIILRYNLQKGIVAIPKSIHENRIKSNADIFDFELTHSDINYLDSLDKGERTGPDPDNFDF